MATRYAIVAGVGPATGRSCALRFAKAYPVVVLARKPESYSSIVDEIKKAGGSAFGISADVSDRASLDAVFSTIEKTLPGASLAAAIYNVGSGFKRKPFLELSEADFAGGLGAATGFFNFAQKVIPQLVAATETNPPHPPTLIFTGATASVRGSPQFASFAAGKFAQRAICQSLAREFGPKGVHVAHAIIDGVIDTPTTASWNANNGVEDGKLNPDDIAETYWGLHAQGRSCFTQEIDARPYVEKF